MRPVLFTIFGVEIISYGFALGLSFLVVLTLSALRSRKEGIEPSLVIDAFLWMFIGAILGARAFYLIQNPGKILFDHFFLFRLWRGGYSSLGGLCGGALVVVIFLKAKRKPILNFLDLISPYLGLGIAIQKLLGCLMAGCCYGKPTDLPWAITFEDPRTLIPVEFLGVPLHPAQIYDAILGLGIFFFIILFRDRKWMKDSTTIRRPGERVLLFLILFSGGRFITDFFRGDQFRRYLDYFSFSQLIFSLILILTFTVYFSLKPSGK